MNGDVERTCGPRRFALRQKSIPAEWTYRVCLAAKENPDREKQA